ncbi:MAG: HlyD family efflux transporter periplasmic adaptor subunit, partial [Candidatus Peregrinibacteria bacterium]|nr:HlyD family efflux transporter periplasmic adaptor subunit [Candidatus Peregrinibacteria bacterium]
MKFINKNFWKISIGTFCVLICGLVIYRFVTSNPETEVPAEESLKKTVEIINYGNFLPEKKKEILSTVEAQQNSNVLAEVSGTIENVSVRIGDNVYKNQVLATFAKSNDATEINYQNALMNLSNTKISAANTVRSAEIALESAKKSEKGNVALEDQNFQKAFSSLSTTAINSETTAKNAFDWADSLLGVTVRFRGEIDIATAQIGKNNFIQKQETKSLIQKLALDLEELQPIGFRPDKEEVLDFAEVRLEFLQEVRFVVRNIDGLIRHTPVTSNFSSTSKATYQTAAEVLSAKVDAQVLGLDSAIETVKSELKRQGSSLTTSNNAVENAEAALELARVTADSQISAAKNSLNLAINSRSDLVIRAPFSGKIAKKLVSAGDRVLVNTKCFEIFNENNSAKVTVWLTLDEFQELQVADHVKIKFQNGEILELSATENNQFSGGTIDAKTQKIKVELVIDDLPEGVLIGSFAKLMIPYTNGTNGSN